ncbi:MAG: class I SAM-dependent methyltransferase [Candidatus Omnitrophica bacterium]|nr:class I SAM-dependent methyltransferase [Candidatus Omnitrophota bacterium]
MVGQNCRICKNVEGNRLHKVREMMFGRKEFFLYLECGNCGCLQLMDIPLDLGQYYPKEYYSFAIPEALGKKDNSFKRFLRIVRSRYLLGHSDILGLLINFLLPPAEKIKEYLLILKRCNIDLSQKILDVGCGEGNWPAELSWYGFKHIVGIDPYMRQERKFPGLELYKRDIFAMDGCFDIILFRHSFEHLDNPWDILKKAREIISADGWLIIRTPFVPCYAWKEYGCNWVAIDAPRHIFIYSEKAMEILANQANFRIVDTVFVSDAFQFWASQQYAQDIPLKSERSYAVTPQKSIFKLKDIQRFNKLARQLNKNKEGDEVCFYLRPQ